MADSAPLQAPWLGPGLPDYPPLDQVCRVYGPAILGTNIYPAFTQQAVLSGTVPALRDREPCYVWEPNNIKLGAGDYDCRLEGSYLGLPLYLTTCCPVGAAVGPSSSSSSSSGSPTSAGSAQSAAPPLPPPFVSCCDYAGELPATLIATLSNIFNCPCVDTGSVELIWTGAGWNGSATVCGKVVLFELTCAPGGTDWFNFQLLIRIQDGGDLGPVSPGTGTCIPFSLSFAVNDPTGMLCGAAGVFRVLITP